MSEEKEIQVVAPDPKLIYSHHPYSRGQVNLVALVCRDENDEIIDLVWSAHIRRHYPDDQPIIVAEFNLFYHAESPDEAFDMFDAELDKKWQEVIVEQELEKRAEEEKVKQFRAQNQMFEMQQKMAKRGIIRP